MTSIDPRAFIRIAEAEATGDTGPSKRALRRVLKEPDNDFYRQVYADELDAVGEYAQAEFIRLQCAEGYQCDWVGKDVAKAPTGNGGYRLTREQDLHRHLMPGFRLIGWEDTGVVCYTPSECWPQVQRIDVTFAGGFVRSVKCTLAQFMGGECGCLRSRMMGSRAGHVDPPCSHCGNTGERPGLVDTLFAEQPVTEVVLSQSTPIQLECDEGNVFHWMSGRIEPESPHFLGQDLYDMVDLPSPHIGGEKMTGKYARTLEEAIAARDTAAVALGRKRAGLKPL